MDPLRVRQARLEAGLSLAQVAGADVSRTFIHFVEHGRSRPSNAVLALIARRTGKPMSYFLQDQLRMSPQGTDLAEELTGIADRVRRFIALRQLAPAEHEGMRLLEVSLQQGAQFARAVERGTSRTRAGSVAQSRKAG